jgi:hypothetical protein
MRSSFLKLTALASTLSLASCSFFAPEQESLGGVLVSTVSSTVGGKLGSKKAKAASTSSQQAAAKATLRALELINRSGKSGLLTTVPKLGRTTVMVEEGRNGAFITYRGTNNTSLTLRSGIVHASRGIGIDLMAQATDQSPAGLFTTGSFPKEYARAQRHLDGENHLQSADFLCVITRTGSETITIVDKKRATTTFEETCKNDRRAFRNQYWVGSGTGTIWQSQQSISSLTGHVIIQYIAAK